MWRLEYKRRIIAEELIEIETAYDDFSSDLVLPYEYFLFKKLHDRAIEYPETIDWLSVAHTRVPKRKRTWISPLEDFAMLQTY